MNALQVLQQRVSVAKLIAPAPDAGQRQAIFRAATRAADHGNLRPWRFLVVEGEGLDHLGELYCQAALADDSTLGLEAQERFRKMPQRAPLIIVAIACCQEHPKVPAQEQILSAGAAVQNMLNAAFALELGAFWRTGAMAYHPQVVRGLGLAEGEQIIGYLYLGTPAKPLGQPKEVDIDAYFAPWPPQ